MRSDAATVEEYLAALEPQRLAAIEVVRSTIIGHLPPGMEEAMDYGMITYQIPLDRYPETYNGRPLMYAALASQKRHMAVYLTSIYMDPDAEASFNEAYLASGKPMDVGKSCVRFKRIDDLPLEVIARAIASTTVDGFIAGYEEARSVKRAP